MKHLRETLSIFIAALAMGSGHAAAAELSFSGPIDSFNPQGFVALGTFKPGFNVQNYAYVYGDDAANLVFGTGYGPAIADGNFRPLVTAFWNGNTILGNGSAGDIQGQRLWLFIFDDPNPDVAQNLALCSGDDALWFGPPDAGSGQISTTAANLFVFGHGGSGQAVFLDSIPIPEPHVLPFIAVAAAIGFRRRRLTA